MTIIRRSSGKLEVVANDAFRMVERVSAESDKGSPRLRTLLKMALEAKRKGDGMSSRGGNEFRLMTYLLIQKLHLHIEQNVRLAAGHTQGHTDDLPIVRKKFREAVTTARSLSGVTAIIATRAARGETGIS